MITGSVRVRSSARTAASSANPSRRGIITSLTRSAGGIERISSSAACPSATSITS
jgi:hypothetical protein